MDDIASGDFDRFADVGGERRAAFQKGQNSACTIWRRHRPGLHSHTPTLFVARALDVRDAERDRDRLTQRAGTGFPSAVAINASG
jgi:hypothetical protein